MANLGAKKKEVKAKYRDEKKTKQVDGHCGLNYVNPTPPQNTLCSHVLVYQNLTTLV